MYHSLTFFENGDPDDHPFNTWTNLHLIPSERPTIPYPSVEKKFVSIPGRGRQLDLTDYMTGQRVFGPRSGSWTFIVDPNYYFELLKGNHNFTSEELADHWLNDYKNIQERFHNKRLCVMLEEEYKKYSATPQQAYQFFEGRFVVKDWKPEDHYSTITIEFDLDPQAYTSKSDYNNRDDYSSADTSNDENRDADLYREAYTAGFRDGWESFWSDSHWSTSYNGYVCCPTKQFTYEYRENPSNNQPHGKATADYYYWISL